MHDRDLGKRTNHAIFERIRAARAMDPFHRAEALLEKHWNVREMREGQREAVQAFLERKDALVVLPTGGGKSLCYQLPALMCRPSVNLVVSPLISLCKDQMDACRQMDIPAAAWNGQLNRTEKEEILAKLKAEDPKICLLYVTPEGLQSEQLLDVLKGIYRRDLLRCCIVDESHCAYCWGHDFRPAYLRICDLRDHFPKIYFQALTATATKKARQGIVEALKLVDPIVIERSFNRPELEYAVRYKDFIDKERGPSGSIDDLAELVMKKKGSGIVYCRTRDTCEKLAEQLAERGVIAYAYHAGMQSARRLKAQQYWVCSDEDVIVATIAFGMGINKPDVRYVVHWNCPATLENLAQESGRAGRDGEPATSVVYVGLEDLEDLCKLQGTNRESVQQVYHYCSSTSCRRAALLRHFGEERCCGPGDRPCDLCAGGEDSKRCSSKFSSLAETGTATSPARPSPKEREPMPVHSTRPPLKPSFPPRRAITKSTTVMQSTKLPSQPGYRVPGLRKKKVLKESN